MKPASEKRSFYRIRDVIGLTCELIGTDADEATGEDMSLAALLGGIDREFNKATNLLWQENPVVAQALGLINRKLAIITSHTLPEASGETEACQEVTVSLSGSGIGFDSAQDFAESARVRLSLVLKPSNIELALTGRVAGCDHVDEDTEPRYWVRVTFEEGNEAAQEQLIQHIVQRQVVQIREGAGGPDGTDPQ